jgi:GT2 family glycosyltransferase
VISVVVISKDEPALDDTLRAVERQAGALAEPGEVVVVDASEGRLDGVRRRHPGVRWLDFTRPPGVRISIPHQRNAGIRTAAGDVVVFTDAGCEPADGWLARLVAPIREEGEDVVAGRTGSTGEERGLYDTHAASLHGSEYLDECPTINLAFRRAAWERIGGFDERFEYGSDIDFSWRLVDAGYRIRGAADAFVRHDWGDPRRQLKRSWAYGRARARLYRKHPGRIRTGWRRDPVPFAYPLFLLGLPLTRRVPAYPLLLALPALRNRDEGPARVIADHLVLAAGVLREVAAR